MQPWGPDTTVLCCPCQPSLQPEALSYSLSQVWTCSNSDSPGPLPEGLAPLFLLVCFVLLSSILFLLYFISFHHFLIMIHSSCVPVKANDLLMDPELWSFFFSLPFPSSPLLALAGRFPSHCAPPVPLLVGRRNAPQGLLGGF